MSLTTAISWTDATHNPWIGCTKVSPGCAHCYAAVLDNKRMSKALGGATKEHPVSHWGPGVPRHRTKTEAQIRQFNRNAGLNLFVECAKCGWRGRAVVGCHECASLGISPVRPRVFCASLGDWLDDEVPIEWLADLLKLIHDTPNLDWLLLTKRPQNFPSRIQGTLDCADFGSAEVRGMVADWRDGKPPANVWLGTTVEDQVRAEERVPVLRSIPARVRFLSCEPLLEPVNLNRLLLAWPSGMSPIHWIICGGESGDRATDVRPMHPDWARWLRQQCFANQIQFLFKQWGEYIPRDQGVPADVLLSAPCRVVEVDGRPTVNGEPRGGWTSVFRVGTRRAGRRLDGALWHQFPIPAPIPTHV